MAKISIFSCNRIFVFLSPLRHFPSPLLPCPHSLPLLLPRIVLVSSLAFFVLFFFMIPNNIIMNFKNYFLCKMLFYKHTYF